MNRPSAGSEVNTQSRQQTPELSPTPLPLATQQGGTSNETQQESRTSEQTERREAPESAGRTHVDTAVVDIVTLTPDVHIDHEIVATRSGDIHVHDVPHTVLREDHVVRVIDVPHQPDEGRQEGQGAISSQQGAQQQQLMGQASQEGQSQQRDRPELSQQGLSSGGLAGDVSSGGVSSQRVASQGEQQGHQTSQQLGSQGGQASQLSGDRQQASQTLHA